MNKLFSLIVVAFLIATLSGTTTAQEIPEIYKVKLNFAKLAKNLATSYKVTNKKKKMAYKPKKAVKKTKFSRTLRVRASAYNSLRGQTDKTPSLAAWGDRLKPGMKVIAVSRDLLTRYGMKHNTIVKIKGLPGTYRVADKMNKRFRKKIDIYMGKDRRRALRWGRRNVTIMW